MWLFQCSDEQVCDVEGLHANRGCYLYKQGAQTIKFRPTRRSSM